MLAAALLAAGCPRPGLVERNLGALPGGIIEETFQTSPNSRHVAFVVKRGERQVLYVDGRPGAEFDQVGRVLLAANGRWAHAAIIGEEGFVVRDGKRSGPYERVGPMFLSDDGSVLAYTAMKQSRRTLVRNGRQGEWYDDIREVIGSPNGRLLCHTASLDGRWYIIAGRERYGPYDEVGGPVLAEDGSRWAVAVREGNSWRLLDNGALRPDAYERIHAVHLAPDAPDVALLVIRDGRFVLIHQGRESAAYDLVLPHGIVFSPDFAHSVFAARSGDTWRFVADGVESPGFDAPVGMPVIGRNGRWAGVGVGDGRAVVLIDGREVDRPDRAHILGAGDDGSRLAWSYYEGDAWHIAVEDERHGPFADVSAFRFDPTGTRAVFAANTGRSWVMVVDGKPIGPYERIIESPSFFSPDGGKVVWGAVRRNRAVIVVDGEEKGPDYDGIRQVVFDGPDRVNFIALRADSLLAVSLTVF